MDGLPRRVDREQPPRHRDGALGGSGVDRERDQPLQHLDGPAPEALTLDLDPFVECRLLEPETVKEVAGVKGGGALELLGRGPLRGLFEGCRVHEDGAGVEGNALTRDREQGVPGREALAQGEEGLPQAVPGLLVADFPPER